MMMRPLIAAGQRLVLALTLFAVLNCDVTVQAESNCPLDKGNKALDAPMVPRPNRARERTRRNKPSADEIVLEKPKAGTVQGDRGQVTVVNPVAGRLAHTFKVPNLVGNFPTYLVLHTLKLPISDQAGKVNPVLTLTYSAQKPINKEADEYGTRAVFNPQFSPDGRYILFKFGEPSISLGTFRLYVFDTLTNTLKLISKRYLSYRLTSWSPDGNYVAFVQGGDIEGGLFAASFYLGPLRLYICNWRTGKENLVTSNDTVRGPFNWTAPHTLLYGALSQESQQILREQQKALGRNEGHQRRDSEKLYQSGSSAISGKPTVNILPQPNIYEYSVEENKSKLLFKDGYRPTASPDGKWIAFFGSEDVNKPTALSSGWEDSPQGAVLSVARRDGSKRVPIDRPTNSYPSVFWMPDNRRLLTIDQIAFSPNAQAQIKEWNTETKRFRQVAIMNAKDYKAVLRPEVEPQFRPLYIDEDHLILFVLVNEKVGHEPNLPYSVSRTSLQAVDLREGAITTIAQTRSDSGIDWHQETVPPTSTGNGTK